MAETAIVGSELAPREPLLNGARRILVATDRRTLVAAAVAVPIAAILFASDFDVATLYPVALAAVVWFFALRGTYREPQFAPLGTTIATAAGTLTGLAVVSLLVVWLPGVPLSTQQLLVLAASVFGTALMVDAQTRSLAMHRRLLLIGDDDATRDLLRELHGHAQLAFDVVGVVADGDDDSIVGVTRLGAIADLQPILFRTRPELVVLGAGPSRSEAMAEVLDAASSMDMRVMDVHHLQEHAFGKVPVHHLSSAWFMGVLHLYQRPYSRLVKRTFDIAVATVALIVLLPLLGIVATTVRLSSRGPVFFRQVRLGEGGALFSICKFRTMIDGAEAPGAAVWAAVNDARVTPVGRVLRRARLDELPQLWNVLRGEMSIVGPRPERPEFVDVLRETVPFWTRRHLVKPGITGWAQVRHGYTADALETADKLAYDLYYLKYRSLLFDIAIVLRTVGIVLTGFGSR